MGPPLGVRSVSMTNTRTLSGGNSHFFRNDHAHDGDKSLPHFGGGTANFKGAVIIEFHFRARFIGRAAAKAVFL